jgi:hypothetical protein
MRVVNDGRRGASVLTVFGGCRGGAGRKQRSTGRKNRDSHPAKDAGVVRVVNGSQQGAETGTYILQ